MKFILFSVSEQNNDISQNITFNQSIKRQPTGMHPNLCNGLMSTIFVWFFPPSSFVETDKEQFNSSPLSPREVCIRYCDLRSQRAKIQNTFQIRYFCLRSIISTNSASFFSSLRLFISSSLRLFISSSLLRSCCSCLSLS